jgi:hypothetical protein
VLYATAACPQIENCGDERRHRENDVCVFNWHPVESLPFAVSGYESITKNDAAFSGGLCLTPHSAEVWHPT